jgi:hypothetical protein
MSLCLIWMTCCQTLVSEACAAGGNGDILCSRHSTVLVRG